jgi:hypothetical protein
MKVKGKHVITPIPQCYFCGQDKDRRSRGKKVQVERAILDHTPCKDCADMMDTGVLLIEVSKGSTAKAPIWKGTQVAVTTEFVEEAFDSKVAKKILDVKFAFIDGDGWDLLGLPREGDE